jgi:hypothetical protein
VYIGKPAHNRPHKHYTSHHPNRTKQGIIKSLKKRAKFMSRNKDTLKKEKATIKSTLIRIKRPQLFLTESS